MAFSFISVVVVLLLTFLVYKIAFLVADIRKTHKIFNDIPGPKDFHWFYGNLHLFSFKKSHERLQFFIDCCSKFPRYFRLWFGFFRPVVFLNHPDTIKVIFKTAGDRCIVNYYEKYLTALGSGKFYRRPLAGTPPRYGEQPVGINKLKNFMKVICDRAGLIGNFTNHSGKRTCATQLYMAGVDEQEIMRRTGHRSEKAVRKYKESSSDISARMSKVLDPPKRKCDEMPDGNENQNENITSVKKMCVDIPIGSSALGDISNRPFFNNCSIAFNYN